jgi:hypothetical protein
VSQIPIDAAIVRMLAVLAGIDVPMEDEQGIVKAFGNVLACGCRKPMPPGDIRG